MDELKWCLDHLRSKAAFAEKMYRIAITYIPLIVEKEVIVLDKRSGKILKLKDKAELSEKELEELKPKILKNIRDGVVELYLTMNIEQIYTCD